MQSIEHLRIKKHTASEERFHQKEKSASSEIKQRHDSVLQCVTVKSFHSKAAEMGSARRCCGDTCTRAALPLPISIPSCFLSPGPFQKNPLSEKKKALFLWFTYPPKTRRIKHFGTTPTRWKKSTQLINTCIKDDM